MRFCLPVLVLAVTAYTLADVSANQRAQFAPAVFRITLNSFSQDQEFQHSCIATRLDDRWAITAAHCLKDPEEFLSIHCREKQGLTQAVISAQVSHPTHDMALLLFAQKIPCLGTDVQVVSKLPQRTALITSKFAASPGEYSPIRETSRDAHTLRLSDKHACLAKGDSGSPIFIGDNGPTIQLVALLISGSPGCPSRQTAVRLDGLLDWISHTTIEQHNH